MKPAPYNRLIMLSALAGLAATSSLNAVTFFWDGTDTTANADGGTGTWNTVLTNWDAAASAGAASLWPSSGTDNDATFGGTAGTVTIDTGGVTANDLTFNTTGYVIGGAGLTLNGTLPVINVGVTTATINSAITTTVAGGFSKTGSGTLILGGSNSFAAGTTLAFGNTTTAVGAIRLANSNALNGITLINGVPASGAATQARIELTSGITVNGTEIRGGGRQTQQGVGALLVNISGDNTWGGAVRINGTGGGHGIRSDAGTLTISGGVNSMIGARTWEIGGSGNVTISGAITSAVSIVKFGTGVLTLSSASNTFTGTTKIGAGSLVITNSAALSTSTLDLATGDTGTFSFGPTITAASFGGLTGARPLSLLNTAATPAAVSLTIGGSNLSSTYTGLLSGAGILFKTGTGSFTLDPGAGTSMTIGALTANGGSLILKSGTITTSATDPTTTSSLNLYNIGAGARGGTISIEGADLVIGGTNANRTFKPGAVTTGNANISSGSLTTPAVVIGHNGTSLMTQSGGTVTTTNLYHQDGGVGTYTLTGGTLIVQSIYNNTAGANAFTLNLNGGTLRAASGTTNLIRTNNTGSQITVLLGSGNTQIDTSLSSATIARPMADISDTVGAFTKIGANDLTLSQANTHTGDSTVSAGSLVLAHSSALGASTLNLAGGSVGFSGITSATFGGLKGSSNLALTNLASAGVSVTLGGNNQSSTYSGAISGTGSLNKVGIGSLTLSNASTYSGGTNVSSGSLVVTNTTGSATGSGAVALTAGGRLGGTGSVGGSVSVGDSSSTFAPAARASGNAFGVGGNLSFTGGSIFNWDLAVTADDTVTKTQQGSYGQVGVAGAVTGSSQFFVNLLGGAGNTTSFADAFWSTSKSWNNVITTTTTDLASVFTSFGGTGVNADGTVTGDYGRFSFSGTTLNWSAVPEPSNAFLVGSLFLGAALRRRRVVGARGI